MTPITASQVRAAKAAQRRIGLDDDAWRQLLAEGWGVSSCTELDVAQAAELLDRLNRGGSGGQRFRARRPVKRGAAREPAAWQEASGTVFDLPSPAQRKLIDQLVAEIDWRTGYAAWLESIGLREPISKSQAQTVIHGLIRLKRYDPAGASA